jgi:hypothetical protein
MQELWFEPRSSHLSTLRLEFLATNLLIKKTTNVSMASFTFNKNVSTNLHTVHFNPPYTVHTKHPNANYHQNSI